MYVKICSILLAILIIAKYILNIAIQEAHLYILFALYAVLASFSGKRISAIEMFDGSSIAFDTEAFENLNRIVNEIAGDGKLTIPGDLIVHGKSYLNNELQVRGKSYLNNELQVKGESMLNNTLQVKGKSYLNNELQVQGNSVLNNTLQVKGKTNLNDTLMLIKGKKQCALHLDERTLFIDSDINVRGIGVDDNAVFHSNVLMSRGKNTNAMMNTNDNKNHIHRLYTNWKDVIKTGDEINIATRGKSIAEPGLRLLYDENSKSRNSQHAKFDQFQNLKGEKDYKIKIRKHKSTLSTWKDFY